MKVAIDKSCINKIKDFGKYNFVYIFDDEPLQDLLALNLHCISKDCLNNLDVDINLTDYKINCFKKSNINDSDWYKMSERIKHKYAIIVPNYNNDHGEYLGKTYLQNCIESILNQTYKDFYLVFVDDMSNDTSVETVKNYKDDRIYIIQNKRKRYNGGSRNVGIEYALDNLDFDYFCFLDSDDWWLHNEVLEHIDRKIYNNDMMTLGSEMIHKNKIDNIQYNKFDTYADIFFCINKIWCTAWSRVIKKGKIVYFCEDTLMEDRVWSYKQADNIDFDKCVCLNEIVYAWNRMNTTNSVSITRSPVWDASAWCHIGHQLQFISNMKHTEFKEDLEKRVEACITKINRGIYQQF